MCTACTPIPRRSKRIAGRAGRKRRSCSSGCSTSSPISCTSTLQTSVVGICCRRSTTAAQIVSDELGVEVTDVKVVHGDTDTTPMGWGTYGSRTTAVGGAALATAVRKIKDKAKVLAAHLLEAAPEDIDYQDGRFFVKG